MAEKRATFSLRRLRALGFSKCRRLRTVFSVPSRSILFLSLRRALSTGSPFLNLISVKSITSFPITLEYSPTMPEAFLFVRAESLWIGRVLSNGKTGYKPKERRKKYGNRGRDWNCGSALRGLLSLTPTFMYIHVHECT